MGKIVVTLLILILVFLFLEGFSVLTDIFAAPAGSSQPQTVSLRIPPAAGSSVELAILPTNLYPDPS